MTNAERAHEISERAVKVVSELDHDAAFCLPSMSPQFRLGHKAAREENAIAIRALLSADLAAAFVEVERAARTEILRRAISAVRDERLSDDPVRSDDIAYNRALDHAEYAIRALSPDLAATLEKPYPPHGCHGVLAHCREIGHCSRGEHGHCDVDILCPSENWQPWRDVLLAKAEPAAPDPREALTTPAWEFYRNGKIVPVTEDEARHQFDSWEYRSCDRGMATLMFDQLWAEIDRLRAALRLAGDSG